MNKKPLASRIAYFLLIVFLTGVMVLPSFNAAYAIFLSKSRIDIEHNQNYAELLILNRSDKKKLVTFSWSDIIVKPDGSFMTLKEGETYPDYMPAQPLIRYSPRRTILNPGESQRVRMYVKRTADMPQGEYHSHFTVVAEPLRPEQSMRTVEGQITGKVSMNAGTSIPVFVRHGKTDVNVTIKDAYLAQKGGIDRLFIESLNNSTRSTYGVVKLACVMPGGERIEKDITIMRLYREVKNLSWNIGLNEFKARECQDLSITVRDPDDFELKGQVYARANVSKR